MIEILSPDDTLTRTRERFRDYAALGVQTLILMDPEEYILYHFKDDSLTKDRVSVLLLPTGSSVPFDSDGLFAHLKAELCET